MRAFVHSRYMRTLRDEVEFSSIIPLTREASRTCAKLLQFLRGRARWQGAFHRKASKDHASLP